MCSDSLFLHSQHNAFTALHRAAYGGYTEVIEALVAASADVHAVDKVINIRLVRVYFTFDFVDDLFFIQKLTRRME